MPIMADQQQKQITGALTAPVLFGHLDIVVDTTHMSKCANQQWGVLEANGLGDTLTRCGMHLTTSLNCTTTVRVMVIAYARSHRLCIPHSLEFISPIFGFFHKINKSVVRFCQHWHSIPYADVPQPHPRAQTRGLPPALTHH